MKLLNIINQRFLILLLIVFTVAGVSFYFVLGFVVNDNIEEILESRAVKVIHTLKTNQTNVSTDISPDQSIKIDLVSPAQTYKRFNDTMIFDIRENAYIECHKLDLLTNINEKYYKIQITLSQFETEDLVQMIFYFMISLFICIVIILFVLNQQLSKSLWSPFFKTLNQLKGFKVGQKKEIPFEKSNINEFNQLNEVLIEMINKIQTDFKNLKEFTENASHEIQTPLAIIKSKLETVLQDKLLSNEHQKQIQITFKTVSRLSKLNESLLLLSKIENRQFTSETEINLCDLVREKVEQLEELLDLKSISIELNIEIPFNIKIDTYLAETLIGNLLGNAIKHNFENGKIIISSFENKIHFSNTGYPLEIEPQKIFHRFVKQNTINESNGLGLSIASEICRNNNLLLKYNDENERHNFILLRNY